MTNRVYTGEPHELAAPRADRPTKAEHFRRLEEKQQEPAPKKSERSEASR